MADYIPPTPGTPAHALRELCLEYPEAEEEFPWGHPAFKVRKKTFVFFGHSVTGLSMSFKLPESSHIALSFDYAEQTGYGLGKSGWVTVKFGPDDEVPVDHLKLWIDESYRAVAPKSLVKTLPDAE